MFCCHRQADIQRNCNLTVPSKKSIRPKICCLCLIVRNLSWHPCTIVSSTSQFDPEWLGFCVCLRYLWWTFSICLALTALSVVVSEQMTGKRTLKKVHKTCRSCSNYNTDSTIANGRFAELHTTGYTKQVFVNVVLLDANVWLHIFGISICLRQQELTCNLTRYGELDTFLEIEKHTCLLLPSYCKVGVLFNACYPYLFFEILSKTGKLHCGQCQIL